MGKKRSTEEKRTHLLEKIRKLDEKIKNSESEKAASDARLQSPSQESHDDNVENINPEALDELVEEGTDLTGLATEEEIDDSILEILGEGPSIDKKAQPLHNKIVVRWQEILKKGMKKEEKDKLAKDNPAFVNCELMSPPKLNPEVSAALADKEMAKRRDQLIEKRQQQVSNALACLGSALQTCIKEDLQVHKLNIIKNLNDASRLLCDSIYLDTKGRRSLVLSVINKDMKEFLVQSEPKEYLFGENLGEKIKTARTVQKTGSDLKIPDNSRKFNNKQNGNATRKPFTANNKALNWRGPPRTNVRMNGGTAAGGPAHSSYRGGQFQRKKEERPYQHNRK
ncbi:uncharacterized protein [Choristoneura fumiferana]|uniref:uncharacterized protein n=1 Tax=Choristoneura fumiferana TaxID=7141 RepID=UPI003D15D14B